jgi:plasmid stabilization system protein ParE
VDREIAWSESALNDLVGTLEFIERDSPSYASTLAVLADRAAMSLRHFSYRGRLVPEYHDSEVRELIVGKSHRLIYQVSSSNVTIVAFVHIARDLASFVHRNE